MASRKMGFDVTVLLSRDDVVRGTAEIQRIQAGREVRIIVKPEAIDDLASARLARDVAKKIEETMQYPGQIRVTVIRETRSTEIAK